jgi:hypothetical protein
MTAAFGWHAYAPPSPLLPKDPGTMEIHLFLMSRTEKISFANDQYYHELYVDSPVHHDSHLDSQTWVP